MAIDIGVRYNVGSLPDIILLTQGYYHWGTHLKCHEEFCTRSRMSLRTCNTLNVFLLTNYNIV